MRELKIRDGDYVAGGEGPESLTGSEALLQRLLFRLTARREGFLFLPDMGSRLYALGQVRRGQRAAAAKQYVTEALREERDVTVTDVSYREETEGGLGTVRVALRYQGESYTLETDIQ